MKRPPFEQVIQELDLLGSLAAFDPVVIGTPPLGIATEDSDIDIACSADELADFADLVNELFGQLARFSLERVEHLAEPALAASFLSSGWVVELFCQRQRTEDQWGVRHFRIERRLLALEPLLRPEILKLKRSGLKTEPAFAQLLGLSGDPYEAIIALEQKSDVDLRGLAGRAFRKP